MTLPLLGGRTWREIALTARAYRLPFDNNNSKQQGYEYVRFVLLQENLIGRAYQRLTDVEREPLMALKAQDGQMPFYQFCAAFGDIRRYRPWHEDAPIHPWRRPVSTAEKLWFLGMVELDKRRTTVILPDEVRAILPPLPRPQAALWADKQPVVGRSALVVDVAALLGALLHNPPRLLHGRWLPPYTLKSINERVSLQEDVNGVRSELHCGRTRFLHYLCAAAGLAQVQGGVLLPTPKAWTWLDSDYGDAWAQLSSALLADLKRPKRSDRDSLWQAFRFPAVSARLWAKLNEMLLPGVYQFNSIVAALRPYFPTYERLEQQVRWLLDKPFTWMGMCVVKGDAVLVLPPRFDAAQNATLIQAEDALVLSLPPTPCLRPMVDMLACATVSDGALHLDADAMVHALDLGYSAAQLALALAELVGAPLSPSVVQQLQAWEQQVSGLRLETVTLLHVRDTATMQDIRSDWRLRPLLGEMLSPRHVRVRDEHTLRQRLKRRGHEVVGVTGMADKANDANGMTEYLLLAVRTYQKLADVVPQSQRVPGRVADWLRRQLPTRADHLDKAAAEYVGQVRQAVRDKVHTFPTVQVDDRGRIEQLVRRAYDTQSAITIRYYSPAAGYETQRTIEPHMIYEQNSATYIEAWCRLDDDSRIFRMDRILEVLE